MNEPTTTITGNLTDDPAIRFTNSGQAAASFTIATTPRFRDGGGEWKDGETWFVRCTAWRDLGSNIAECLTKGSAVVATGRLRARSWEADDGTKRTVIEMTVDDLGPSLRRAVAKITKAVRERADAISQPPADPWAALPADAGSRDEPPF